MIARRHLANSGKQKNWMGLTAADYTSASENEKVKER